MEVSWKDPNLDPAAFHSISGFSFGVKFWTIKDIKIIANFLSKTMNDRGEKQSELI